MPRLVLMVGNIGSGKSTAAKRYAASYVCVARDQLRYMFGGGDYRFDPELEPIVFDLEKQIIERLMSEQRDILIDEISVSKLLRAPYISLAKKYGYAVYAHVMPLLTKEESVNRRMAAPHGTGERAEWEGVWEKFNRMYESPLLSEGFMDIVYENENGKEKP